MGKMDLTEATMMALQGKLLNESYVFEPGYHEWLLKKDGETIKSFGNITDELPKVCNRANLMDFAEELTESGDFAEDKEEIGEAIFDGLCIQYLDESKNIKTEANNVTVGDKIKIVNYNDHCDEDLINWAEKQSKDIFEVTEVDSDSKIFYIKDCEYGIPFDSDDFVLIDESKNIKTESEDLSYIDSDCNRCRVYYAVNSSGYKSLGLVINDKDKKFQVVYGQQLGWGHKTAKKSKKQIWEMAKDLYENGYEEVRGPSSVVGSVKDESKNIKTEARNPENDEINEKIRKSLNGSVKYKDDLKKASLDIIEDENGKVSAIMNPGHRGITKKDIKNSNPDTDYYNYLTKQKVEPVVKDTGAFNPTNIFRNSDGFEKVSGPAKYGPEDKNGVSKAIPKRYKTGRKNYGYDPDVFPKRDYNGVASYEPLDNKELNDFKYNKSQVADGGYLKQDLDNAKAEYDKAKDAYDTINNKVQNVRDKIAKSKEKSVKTEARNPENIYDKIKEIEKSFLNDVENTDGSKTSLINGYKSGINMARLIIKEDEQLQNELINDLEKKQSEIYNDVESADVNDAKELGLNDDYCEGWYQAFEDVLNLIKAENKTEGKLVESDNLYIYSDANSYDRLEAENNLYMFRQEAPKLKFKIRTEKMGSDTMYWIDFIGTKDDLKDYLTDLGWYTEVEAMDRIEPYKNNKINEARNPENDEINMKIRKTLNGSKKYIKDLEDAGLRVYQDGNVNRTVMDADEDKRWERFINKEDLKDYGPDADLYNIIKKERPLDRNEVAANNKDMGGKYSSIKDRSRGYDNHLVNQAMPKRYKSGSNDYEGWTYSRHRVNVTEPYGAQSILDYKHADDDIEKEKDAIQYRQSSLKDLKKKSKELQDRIQDNENDIAKYKDNIKKIKQSKHDIVKNRRAELNNKNN